MIFQMPHEVTTLNNDEHREAVCTVLALPSPAAADIVSTIGEAARTLKGEDAALSSILSLFGGPHSIAGVMDGHGGPHAARHCSAHLPEYLKAAADSGASREEACTQAFARCHAEVASLTSTAGTTCTLVLLDHTAETLLCCNVGDSNAVMVTTLPPA